MGLERAKLFVMIWSFEMLPKASENMQFRFEVSKMPCVPFSLLVFQIGSLCVQVGVFVSACAASDMTRIQLLAQAVAKEHTMLICYVNHSWGRLAWVSLFFYFFWCI